jgi:hypothetical protein
MNREDGKSILEAAFSVLNTSGKYREDGTYEGTSLGSFGIGSKITNFLSHWCEVYSYRDGQCEHVSFREGEFSSREVNKSSEPTGTVVEWLPSEEFFEHIEPDITALKKLFVIEDMEAWNPNLRSKTAIRTSDNHYFIDPSIATAALGLGPNDLINDLNTFGLFFETLCVRDLRVYAEANDGNVFHYRDKSGLECDAVIHLRNGSYGLIEIKLGGETLINEGVRALTNLADKIDTTKMKAPSFRMILTAVGKFAYRRTDGVYVIPIGCLKD